MHRFKDVTVAVGLDGRDRTLVEYAELVAFMAHSDRVRFVHVRPTASSLTALYPEFAALPNEVDPEIRRQLEALAAEEFHGPTNTHVEAEVVEGNPLAELLRTTRDAAVDLLVVGKDREGGTLAEKLARKAPCSVLIVPEEVPAQVERVLVPVDFSDHAADAVDVAVAFAEAAALTEIHVLHVYGVPTAYLKMGKTRAEVQGAIHDHVARQLDAFVSTLDLHGLTAVRHVVDDDDVHRGIHDQIGSIDADMVVIGTRGRTATAAVLLGSVAEQTVRTSDVPVVAVKRKGATVSLIDALFEL